MPNPYPQKPTETDHEVLDLIKDRWSPMSFSDERIEEEKIMSCFEAARWAPSSYNEQPWRFLYTIKDDSEAFEKMSSLLVEGNSWAKDAYMLVLVYASKKFKRNEKENRHHAYDTGSAVQSFVLQAASMGIITHMMAGYDKEKSQEIYSLDPETFESICMMAVGYPGNEEDLSEDLLERQKGARQRMKVEEFIKKAS